MDEMELLKQILESSEDVEVPESLKPENIEKKLRAVKESNAAPKTVSFTKRITRYSEMAAAVCVLIVAGFAVNNMRNSDTLFKKSVQMEEVAETEIMEKAEEDLEALAEMVSGMAEQVFCEDMDVSFDYGAEEDCIQTSDEKFTYRVEEDGSKIVICGNDTQDQVMCELSLRNEKMKITALTIKEDMLYVTLSEGSEAVVDVADPAKPVFVSNKLVWK